MQVRNTTQRKLILDIMTNNYTHPTADEIYEKARSLDSHISRGTVYRNLAFLSEEGSILKIAVPNGADHYDSTLSEHYHFCCQNCQKMLDVPEGIELDAKKSISKMQKDGFTILGHSLLFTGICPNCRL